MVVHFEAFLANLARVREELAAACADAGRDPFSVAVLPVTKNHGPDAVRHALRAGLTAVGENRVQEARDKRAAVDEAGLRWELIGRLQSNKAGLAAGIFDRVQSVDSPRLAGLLDRAAAAQGRVLPVLVQVNAGRDPAKSGCDPDDAPALVEGVLALPHLRLDGLMTIAPLSDDPAVAGRTFAHLRELRDRLRDRLGAPLAELSMGMSGDLAAAVRAGSTQVRVGTALFGPRA